MPTIDCNPINSGPIKRMSLESVFMLFSFIKDRFNYKEELQADLRLSAEDVRFSFDEGKIKFKVNTYYNTLMKIKKRFREIFSAFVVKDLYV